MAQGKFISYLRVSTDKQGKSGLGLEAQREAVSRYLNGGDWELLKEYVEVESGKKDDRPQLTKALHQCKVTGAMLVIAKLDRLSRDAHFLLSLQKEKVKFVATDMPEANSTMVGFMAIMAQHEREMISKRTKEALAAWKVRNPDKRLGNPNGAACLQGLGNDAAIAKVKAIANTRADDIKPILDDIRGSGVTTARGIASELNQRGILTPRNKHWHPTSVVRLLKRLEANL